jgi:hypothetical protein
MDERTRARTKKSLKGKDAGQEDFQGDEADRGCGASKGVYTRHSARTPAVEVSNFKASFGLLKQVSVRDDDVRRRQGS